MVGEGTHRTQGTVQSVSEQTDQVTIELDKDPEELQARYACTIRVPLTRVQPLRNEVRGRLSFQSRLNDSCTIFTSETGDD